MDNKERATERTRTYPTDAQILRVVAKERGGKTIPADIISELLKKAGLKK